MTDHPPESNRGDPAEPARQRGRTAEWSGRTLATVTIVAVISLVVGGTGVWLALRHGWMPLAAGGAEHQAEASSAPTAAQNDMAGMPGMAGMSGMTSAAPARPSDASDKAVYISPARQQLIGVRTAAVTHRTLDTTIRTVGTLAYDETRVTMVHTRIAGWVDQIFVDFVGKQVRRGEPLFTIYSPDLVATQNEYLLALRARQQLGGSKFPETRTGADSLVAATRERLKLWDISDAQVAELEQTGQVRKNVAVYSPFNGIVLERNTYAGHYLTPDVVAFKIADLSRIWVLGQFFESEIRMLTLGQEAEIQFPDAAMARTLTGGITFIYPEIDAQTRRIQVRIELANPGLDLKPGTFVTVVVHKGGGSQLAIPKEAVIDTGAKRYAIVALADGYFDPREIEVGPPDDEFYPVLKGLGHGDTVVTSAQFLVDSEANLQEAMKAMSASMPGMENMPGMEGMPGMAMPETPQKPGAKPKEPGR
jgi:membrane fusion protein, copper/silver efflux system